MRALKHILVFLGVMLLLAPIFGLAGFYDFQPSLNDMPLANWLAYTLGLTVGHPLPYVISIFASVLLIRPKGDPHSSVSS